MNKKYYQILGVSENATPAEIKAAYRNLARIHHPDKGGDPEKFKEIQKAYEILSDPTAKVTYDLYGDSFESMDSGGANPYSNTNEMNEMRQKWAEFEAQKNELQKKELLVKMRGYSILLIIDEFFDYVRVTENDLDTNLWLPYGDWKEKIKNSSFQEVDAFREQMISAIREEGEKKKQEEQEEQGSNSIKRDAINRIEKKLKDKNIKPEELEAINSDYKKAINNSGETVNEILFVEEKIQRDISIKYERKKGNKVSDYGKFQEDSQFSEVNHSHNSRYNERTEIPSKRWYWRR